MTINYSQAREAMVEQQIRPWDVLDLRILDTLNTLPREAFVLPSYRALAYADLELPLGHGQLMMKPVLEGRTLQSLALQENESVLEIGTGSGFLAACLGALAHEVVSLEIVPELAEQARANLDATHLGSNVAIETADAFAYETGRRFDVVVLTGATAELPEQFARWLKPGGRLFAICGQSPAQEAVIAWNDVNGLRIQSLFETDLPYLTGGAPAPHFVF